MQYQKGCNTHSAINVDQVYSIQTPGTFGLLGVPNLQYLHEVSGKSQYFVAFILKVTVLFMYICVQVKSESLLYPERSLYKNNPNDAEPERTCSKAAKATKSFYKVLHIQGMEQSRQGLWFPIKSQNKVL